VTFQRGSTWGPVAGPPGGVVDHERDAHERLSQSRPRPRRGSPARPRSRSRSLRGRCSAGARSLRLAGGADPVLLRRRGSRAHESAAVGCGGARRPSSSRRRGRGSTVTWTRGCADRVVRLVDVGCGFTRCRAAGRRCVSLDAAPRSALETRKAPRVRGLSGERERRDSNPRPPA